MTKNIGSFAKLAKFYDKDFEEYSPFNTYYERPAMINLIDNVDGKYILDAGCAGGWYSEKLLEMGANVTSIDINEKMIEIAKKRVSNKADILCCDLNKELPFNNDSFDMIISSLTLHYVNDLEKTFKEFKRILKPNSTLLYSTHHPYMNFKRNNEENYFNHHLKSEIWKKGGKNPVSVKINFHHRSFEKIINTTTKFFILDKVIEPKPVSDFKVVDEENYHYLNKNPHFLIVKSFTG
jgi:SAM-dependent methyltransferase